MNEGQAVHEKRSLSGWLGASFNEILKEWILDAQIVHLGKL